MEYQDTNEYENPPFQAVPEAKPEDAVNTASYEEETRRRNIRTAVIIIVAAAAVFLVCVGVAIGLLISILKDPDNSLNRQTKRTENKPTVETNAPSAQTNYTARQELDQDTLRWIYAANAMVYNEDFDASFIGGCNPKNTRDVNRMKSELKESWDIDSKKDLLKSYDKLLKSGHREGCQTYIDNIIKNGWDRLTPAAFDRAIDGNISDGKERCRYVAAYLSYRELGENQIAGWDYTRALRLLDRGYIAGYIDLNEYISNAVPVALLIQETFSDWDSVWFSFTCGNLYWGWQYYDADMSAEFFGHYAYYAMDQQTAAVRNYWEKNRIAFPSFLDTELKQ